MGRARRLEWGGKKRETAIRGFKNRRKRQRSLGGIGGRKKIDQDNPRKRKEKQTTNI